MEGIAELVDEIDSLHVNIADQAMEYIHTEYVIACEVGCHVMTCQPNGLYPLYVLGYP